MLGLKRMKANWRDPARRVELADYILADPELLGGEPVFRGTGVPAATLFEHLVSGCPLDEFLECFPSVSRESAVAVRVETGNLWPFAPGDGLGKIQKLLAGMGFIVPPPRDGAYFGSWNDQ